MKRFRRVFYALVALGLVFVVTGAVREQGWRAVLKALVDALPVIGVLAAVFVGFRLMDRREARMRNNFYRHGNRAEGTVVGVERKEGRGGAGYEIAAEFAVDGKTYRAKSGRLPDMPRRAAGDAVPVYYNPDDPEDNGILDGDVK